jgi:UDP-3-O-[3-hydroxymyristoyl] glucosamine N-acyltransferase
MINNTNIHGDIHQLTDNAFVKDTVQLSGSVIVGGKAILEGDLKLFGSLHVTDRKFKDWGN